MKSKFLVVILSAILSSNSSAFNDDPSEMFNTSKNYTDNSFIKWTPVDNVQKTCDQESKKRGYGGISWSITACSFFNGNRCDIYTARQVNMHTLGHEVRHCFQGSFH